MNNGQQKIGPMDIIRAENGDKDAIQKILYYFCECTDREMTPDSAIMTYLSDRFQSFLQGDSFDKAFSLIGEEGRPKGEHFERNALLVIGMAYEKSLGLSDINAFENTADRHAVTALVVKRAWQAKPDDAQEIPLRDLVDDMDIDEYEKLFIKKKARS